MADHRDSVSATMGSLLIRGYKMLADSCSICDNVLMQDRKGVIVCVNCNAMKESEPMVGTTTMEVEHLSSLVVVPITKGAGDSLKRKCIGETSKSVQVAEESLLNQIRDITESLRRGNVLTSDELHDRLAKVQYIRECAEAIKSLQDIRI